VDFNKGKRNQIRKLTEDKDNGTSFRMLERNQTYQFLEVLKEEKRRTRRPGDEKKNVIEQPSAEENRILLRKSNGTKFH